MIKVFVVFEYSGCRDSHSQNIAGIFLKQSDADECMENGKLNNPHSFYDMEEHEVIY